MSKLPRLEELIVALDDAVSIVARFWIADPDRSTDGRIRSEHAREIVARLEREGIELGASTPRSLEEPISVGRGPGSSSGYRRHRRRERDVVP